MVSTPSRSSAATRMSLPCMVGPTSARSGAAAGFGSIVVLLMLRGALWPVIAGKEKTHDRCQPWAPGEIGSGTTRRGATVTCDDDDPIYNLQRTQSHQHES